MNTTSAEAANANNGDTWIYDKEHPEGLNTFKDDKDFKPREADSPISEQRRMSITHHKNEKHSTMVSLTPQDAGENPEQVLQRRRSSVSSRKSTSGRRPSRKATGSYGDDTSKPLSNSSAEDKHKVLNSTSNPSYFSEGLPSHSQ